VPDHEFAAGRAAVLRSLLATKPLFGTRTARLLWEDSAHDNLTRELAATDGPHTAPARPGTIPWGCS
jgi:predicted metal-dependent HD superfamily phosphohydrolase